MTQLQVVGERAGVPVFAPEKGNQGSDPDAATVSATRCSVARDGVAEATARQHDVVIIDTAGRLGIDDGADAAGRPTSAPPCSPTRCCSSSTR